MVKKDINKSEFTEETKLKLDLFRECFREWFPVFVHHPNISHIYVYDLFAGSGKDSVNHPGSPVILFQESRGDRKQHCKSLIKQGTPVIKFAFNEQEPSKRIELEKNVSEEYNLCRSQCFESSCPFDKSFYYKQEDFSNLIRSQEFEKVLSNSKYAKFILLDQYGFKQINDEVFLKLINSQYTDFIFFIASSFIRRFKDLPAVTAYFDNNKISYSETKPKECHRIITDYFKNLIPQNIDYYLHSFTIQKGTNYYGLIFGSKHSLGMEKFIKVCWKHDPLAGESNCNINDDFEPGTLFYKTENPIKKHNMLECLRKKILHSEILDNEVGLKYTLKNGCEPKLFVDIVKELLKQGKIQIDGKFNRMSTNIHRVEKYKIVVNEDYKNRMD